MKRGNNVQAVLGAFRGRQFKPTVILSVSTITLMTWAYFGSPKFYHSHLADRFVWFGSTDVTGAVYSFLGSLVLFGLLPALIVKLVFRESLADYGLRLGNVRRTFFSFTVLAPIFATIAFFAARDPAFHQIYPTNPRAGYSHQVFALHAATYLLFYLGWEFQFRGFMQHGLKESMGPVSALLVQTIVSVIMHLGKPAGETFGSIAGAVLWGILAYRTRSIFSGMFQHYLMGIVLDWFICHPQ